MTSSLIGDFCAAATHATHAAFGPGPLARYDADLVVPRDTALEIAVLKGVAAHLVMRAVDRVGVLERQRTVVCELVEALQGRAPGVLEAPFQVDFAAAGSDADRLRVVVDQVASLTDASAYSWHRQLC
jgi:dGTPase